MPVGFQDFTATALSDLVAGINPPGLQEHSNPVTETAPETGTAGQARIAQIMNTSASASIPTAATGRPPLPIT